MSLSRALEIASDFVDAAGETHPVVVEMIAANNAVAGTEHATWRGSALAVYNAGAGRDYLAQLIGLTQTLSTSLNMDWKPSPALRRQAGLDADGC